MAFLKNHPGMWLRDDAAAAINALEDKYGVIRINSAGRYEWEQQNLINRWDLGGPANRPPNLFEPARPARTSNHVKNGGEAVDVYNYTSDRSKLNEFGFEWYGSGDPVHYTFKGWSGGGSGSNWPANAKYGVDWVKEFQAKANRLGAGLAVDGQDGPATQAWVSAFQKAQGLTVDGIAGPDTNAKLDAVLTGGGAKLVVDGELGRLTIIRLQAAFGVTQDGDIGPGTISAIQKHFGVTVDGQLGPVTIKALQRALKVDADGELGPITIKALQTWLNDGGYLAPVPEPTNPTTPPKPTKPEATPREPVYPDAIRGWNVPLSSDRVAGASINWFIIHHQASTNDDESYFKSDNSRTSCPTWQVKADGSIVEFIEPSKRPSSSGAANGNSVAVETQNTTGAPNWGISAASHESIAQLVAWVSQQKSIGGIPVNLVLDRAHVFGDNEITAKTGLPMRATACPGPSMDMDWIVTRAKDIVAEATPVDPKPDPEEIKITVEKLHEMRDASQKVTNFFDGLLAQATD